MDFSFNDDVSSYFAQANFGLYIGQLGLGSVLLTSGDMLTAKKKQQKNMVTAYKPQQNTMLTFPSQIVFLEAKKIYQQVMKYVWSDSQY